MDSCKHGVPGDCSICLADAAAVQTLKPFRMSGVELAGVAVGTPADSETCRAVLVSAKIAAIENVPLTTITWVHVDDVPVDELAHAFRRILAAGGLNLPAKPLEKRETSEFGPPTCWNADRSSLGFEEWSLGCSDCGYYACRCGSCMCDSLGGRNREGQVFPPQGGLRIEKAVRSAYVKVAHLLLGSVRKRDPQNALATRPDAPLPATAPVRPTLPPKRNEILIPIGEARPTKRDANERRFAVYLTGILNLIENECHVRKGAVKKDIRELGAVAAARRMLNDKSRLGEEVVALLKVNRKELLIETIVAGEEWSSLFNEADRKQARAMLEQLQRR